MTIVTSSLHLTLLPGTALILPDNTRVKGCATLPSLYNITDNRCQVHVFNLTPVPLTINAGVPVISYEFTDLPICEFDLPAPSPVFLPLQHHLPLMSRALIMF